MGLLDLGGNSSHHGFEFEVTRQFSSGLYLRGWIARLNTLNDIQGGLFGSTVGLFIEDPYDRANEKGHQNGFTPYEARIVAVYPLPFGKNWTYGSNANRFLQNIIGGWTLAPEWRDRNGTRFTAGCFFLPEGVPGFAAPPPRLADHLNALGPFVDDFF